MRRRSSSGARSVSANAPEFLAFARTPNGQTSAGPATRTACARASEPARPEP